MKLLPESIIGRYLLALWVSTISLLPLIVKIAVGGGSDDAVGFVWVMIFMTFPLGLAVVKFFESVPVIMIPNGFAFYLIIWSIFFLVGYFQWFVLIPSIYRKWKTSNKTARPDR